MIKYTITGVLKPLNPLYIGTGIMSHVVDMPIYRDSVGNVVIPGTTLAGALRHHATILAAITEKKRCDRLSTSNNASGNPCDCVVCSLFGSTTPSEYVENNIELSSSKVWVYDAVAKSENKQGHSHIRDHVGIDRETEAAAHTAKFNREIMGADIEFGMTLGIEQGVSKRSLEILMAVLTEWSEGRCFVGGGRTKGNGRFKLEDLKFSEIKIDTIDDLTHFLQIDNPFVISQGKNKRYTSYVQAYRTSLDKTESTNYVAEFVEIKLDLKVDGGMVISDLVSENASGYDIAPLCEDNKYVIPGTTLRGALRFQAERIARTILTYASKTKKDFLEQCPACNPLAPSNIPLASCASLIVEKRKKSSQRRVHPQKFVKYLCPACQFFGSTYQASNLYISDSIIKKPYHLKILDFVAIDRFTGGASNQAKFDAVVLMYPEFEATLYLERPEEWQIGWLKMVIDDVQDGFVSIGWGKSKWFGHLGLKNYQISRGYLQPAMDIKNDCQVSGICHVIHRDFTENEYSKFRKSFFEKIKSKSLLHRTDDTYFGRFNSLLEQLYPVYSGGQ